MPSFPRPTSLLRVPHMMNLQFDPISETTPIIFYGILTHFIVVSADSPFKTLKDMLIYAKQNPDKLTFGNPGHGTVPHLTMAGMALETGLKFSHIPFAGENKEIAAVPGSHLMAAGIAINRASPRYRRESSGRWRFCRAITGFRPSPISRPSKRWQRISA